MSSEKLSLSICITSLAATIDELKKIESILPILNKYFEVKLYKDLIASDIFGSQPVQERVDSINWALKNADIVMAYNGGFNSIELFDQFADIESLKQGIFVGYSDNTLLANGLPATGKSRGWLGPMMASFIKYPESIDLWAKNIIAWYTDDFALINQQYNQFDIKVVNPGAMEGKVWGGNCYSFDLLQGTGFCPKFTEPFIYILEGEDFITDKSKVWQDTIRNLDSIMLQPGARENMRGLLVGKFPRSYKLNTEELMASIAKRRYLTTIPLIYDFPRGYSQPSLALPIGEKLLIEANIDNTVNINRL